MWPFKSKKNGHRSIMQINVSGSHCTDPTLGGAPQTISNVQLYVVALDSIYRLSLLMCNIVGKGDGVVQ